MIRTALVQNYDLRDAVARVEAARANLGITRSDQFPQFGASGGVEINRFSRDGATPMPPVLLPDQNRNFGEASLNLLSFEVDLWGKLRRATEAARANLLSAEENRKAVITTLVSDVATAYLTLRELDYELEISNETLETRQESLNLTKSRQSGGVATLLDLRQAEQLVDTAAQTIPVIEQQIEQTENQIHLLLGEPPGTSPARKNPHRAGSASRGSRRPAIGIAGTPPRHSRRGAEPDRRQRRHRRGQGRVFSAVDLERIPGRAKHSTHESVQRTHQRVDSCAAGRPAHLHRGTLEIERQADRGPARAMPWCSMKRPFRPHSRKCRTV